MINKNIVIPIIVFIIIIIIFITLILGIYYFNWFEKEKNSYEIFIPEQKIKYDKLEFTDATVDSTKIIKFDNKILNQNYKRIKEKIIPKTIINEKKYYKYSSKNNKKPSLYKKQTIKEDYSKIKKQAELSPAYSKGSNIPDQNFDSYGEYVSEEDYQYRTSLIKNLRIKTIVIDRLTKSNGISQEFFKVVYTNKMIPAKILEQLVESKEFRKLIPKKYLSEEIKINGLLKGQIVKFKNTDIKNILILWSLGRLCPVQKAWKVKAEK